MRVFSSHATTIINTMTIDYANWLGNFRIVPDIHIESSLAIKMSARMCLVRICNSLYFNLYRFRKC